MSSTPYVKHFFNLSQETKAILRSKVPKFGFGGFGETVYYRTYSRLKKDGSQEHWKDTVIRVVEGILSIRKDYYLKNGLGGAWNEKEWQTYARGFSTFMFDMKFLPPGRGLWAMGTDFVYNRGAAALYNCAATDTEDIVTAAEWTMDLLMHGVGVGFNTSWKGFAIKPNKNKTFVYTIPDSREGWVESLVLLMRAYIPKNGLRPFFPIMNYSKIRPMGSPIKGFGGIASGPEPLKKLHKRVESYLDSYLNKSKTEYDKTRLVADIMNSIGSCVVAGNVRRCLPKGTLVHTTDGLIPIEDIKPGMKAITSNGIENISEIIKQGVQKLLVIKTQTGYLRCTSKHKITVMTKPGAYIWKEASKLEVNDRIAMSKHVIPGIDTKLPTWSYEKSKHSTTCKDITIPELDEDMAWFFGYFHGDGYVYANKKKNGFNAYVSLACAEDHTEIIERVKKQLKRFGTNLNIVKPRPNDRCFKIRTQSKQLAYYFHENLKQPKTSIDIPEFILLAKPTIRLAYLAGLFDADGSTKTRPVNLVATVYSKYAKQVQSLYGSLGILTRLKCTPRKTWQDIYYVNIVGPSSIKELELNFKTYSLKYNRLTKTNRSRNDFSFEKWMIDRSKVKYHSQAKHVCASIYERLTGTELLLIPNKILSISVGESVETYDISVPASKEFCIDEGYLVHNSAQLSLGSIDDDTFLNLKNYKKFPEREEIGWMSNNSVSLSSSKDFLKIPKIVDRIKDNGEPGILNIINIQKYGRYGKESPDKAFLCNPCGEIELEDKEVCNLVEVFRARCKNDEEFYQALEYATFYASTVSLLPTHVASTNVVVARNRRIGVSLSGIADINDEIGAFQLTQLLRSGYNIVKDYNIKLAKEAGVQPSIRVTTVKPSGTLSQLVGVSSGMHFPTFKYAIRRMRVSMNSPIAKTLIDSNVPYEEDSYSDNTWVFEFPIDQGDTRTATEVSMWEQFALLAMLQREWSDNMVSATIYFNKEKESHQIEHALGQFIPLIKSVSMLPHTEAGAYKQMPYEGITKEEYELRKSKMPKIDWLKFGGSDGQDTKFCNGDRCTVLSKA